MKDLELQDLDFMTDLSGVEISQIEGGWGDDDDDDGGGYYPKPSYHDPYYPGTSQSGEVVAIAYADNGGYATNNVYITNNYYIIGFGGGRRGDDEGD
ncbi:MAG: hypothetical protein QNJ47_11015 [Nostocaceae cyanobacterium]|nr:hypothetical protein [Nostocaceae cyanobacterium]